MFRYLIPTAALWWLSDSHPALAAALAFAAVLCAAAWAMRSLRRILPRRRKKSGPATRPVPVPRPATVTYNILNIYQLHQLPRFAPAGGPSPYPVIEGEVL